MIAGIADTHAAIWYLANDVLLSAKAKMFIENAAGTGNSIGISSITLIEMVYLVEKGRIPANRFTQLARQLRVEGSIFTEVPVDLDIARALSRINVNQIPDMPDRIIAATALHFNVPVISKDHRIQLPTLTTIW